MNLTEEAAPTDGRPARWLIAVTGVGLAVAITTGVAVYQVDPTSTWALSPTALAGCGVFGAGCLLMSGPAWLRPLPLILIAVGAVVALTHANL